MLVIYLASQFTVDGERDTGTLGRWKEGGWEPHGSPEAISEKLLSVHIVLLRCGPPSWMQFDGDGSWQKHISLRAWWELEANWKQVGSRRLEPGPSLLFLTVSPKFPVKARLRMA